MNPRRRRTHRRRRLYGAALAAHLGRPIRRRRHVRRNPVKRRRTVRAVARRVAPPKMTPAMRRKVSAGVRRYFAQKRANRSIARRAVTYVGSFRRRASRRSSFGGAGLMGGFKGAFTKPLLMKAAGAVVASFGTGMLMQKFGASLPGSNNKWGRVAYSMGIPIMAAVLIRKKQRDLAEGMVIGGLVMGINALIQQVKPAGVAPVAAYPEISGYGVAGELGRELGYSWYPGQTTNMGMTVNRTPFVESPW